ncbi:MAG: hypothetical protein GY794_14840, partial [bacterium]|nr:hypothetical protein [bacterium]
MDQTEYLQRHQELERALRRTNSGSDEETKLRQQLDRLEREFQQTAAAPKLPELNPILRNAYLPQLLQQVSRLELSGIDRKAAGDHADACLNLGAIYTALLTFGSEHVDSDLLGTGLAGKREQRLSALAQLNQEHSLVLLGNPGSGKSTFVKFVAMCLAGALLQDDRVNLELLRSPLPDTQRDEKKPPAPQPWEHGPLLPILVILRDFAAKGLPPEGQAATGRHLWDFITAGLKEKLLSESIAPIQSRLRKQGGLLLLDGLDEVPKADRRRVQIKQAVEQFRDLFPRCRILVT